MRITADFDCLSMNERLTADELEAINDAIFERSKDDRTIHYGAREEFPTSRSRLAAIVSAAPEMPPREAAAWLIRAIVLIQPFPDGNHRTAVTAAELVLRRRGVAFAPTPEQARTFHREVSNARRSALGGYDDAPLSALVHWDDEVMRVCRGFVGAASVEDAEHRK
jgi:prophage maintenance system killer protein